MKRLETWRKVKARLEKEDETIMKGMNQEKEGVTDVQVMRKGPVRVVLSLWIKMNRTSEGTI